LLLALFAASPLFGESQKKNGFVPLFDGKTLKGWTPTPGGKWEVKDGAIVGTSPVSERRHGILLTDSRFKDFTIRAKSKSSESRRSPEKEPNPSVVCRVGHDVSCYNAVA
ncbi:MAG: DUF1080 domain-containing protein, partial [Planctomycetes bacterium]|nr:DUF1080 domain-containing protein [Planctomycetota bacterium]